MFKSPFILTIASSCLLTTAAYAAQKPPINPNPTPITTTCAEEADCITVSAEDIDLLIFYDPNDERKYNGSPRTFFEAWKNQVNDMYRVSGVGLRLNIVGIEAYDPNPNVYSKKAQLDGLIQNNYVNQRRNQLGADFVTLVKSGDNDICGTARVLRNSDEAFSVLQRDCGATTLAHELGHNMGLNHSRKQGKTGGTRHRYGLGYGIQGAFSTIMAYPDAFGLNNRNGRFSNPKLKCAGFACGIEAGLSDEADAVRALNDDRRIFSQFRVPYRNRSLDTSLDGGSYALSAAHSEQCLTDNKTARQQVCNQAPEQTWHLRAISADVYNILNKKGECLSISDNQNYNGTSLITSTCDGSEYQQWQFSANTDNYNIKSIATDRYIEVQGASTDSGAIVDQWNFYNGPNQTWVLKSI